MPGTCIYFVCTHFTVIVIVELYINKLNVRNTSYTLLRVVPVVLSALSTECIWTTLKINKCNRGSHPSVLQYFPTALCTTFALDGTAWPFVIHPCHLFKSINISCGEHGNTRIGSYWHMWFTQQNH